MPPLDLNELAPVAPPPGAPRGTPSSGGNRSPEPASRERIGVTVRPPNFQPPAPQGAAPAAPEGEGTPGAPQGQALPPVMPPANLPNLGVGTAPAPRGVPSLDTLPVAPGNTPFDPSRLDQGQMPQVPGLSGDDVAAAAARNQQIQNTVARRDVREDSRNIGATIPGTNFNVGVTLDPATLATIRGATRPLSLNMADEGAAALGALFPGFQGRSRAATYSERYNENLVRQRAIDAAYEAEFPRASLAGEVGGALAQPAAAASRLGIRGVMALGGLTGFLNGFGGGQGEVNRAAGAGIGATVGTVAAPVIRAAGTGVNALWNAGPRQVYDTVARRVAGLRPEQAAQAQVNRAAVRDYIANPEQMTRVAAAARRGEPALPADLGSNLQSAASNAVVHSPNARGMFEGAGERLRTQGQRMLRILQRAFPHTDNPERLAQLRAERQRANRANYQLAHAEAANLPNGAVMNGEIQRLMTAPEVVEAMKRASERGQNRAVVDGFGAMNTRAHVAEDGMIRFTNRGGLPTEPDLRFWDYVQRELRDSAEAAIRAGRNEEGATTRQLRNMLNEQLDTLVPSFRDARLGAWARFGVEDALEAGEKFVMGSGMSNTAARRMLATLSPEERREFSHGFAAELARRLENLADTTNIVNRIYFNSPAARERLRLALGARGAGEMEILLRLENIFNLTRQLVTGNSATARRALEAGLAGGGLTVLSGNQDPMQVGAVAVLTGLLRTQAGRIDTNVAEHVGRILSQGDVNALVRFARQASQNRALGDMVRNAEARASQSLTGQADNVAAQVGIRAPSGLQPARAEDQPQSDRAR